MSYEEKKRALLSRLLMYPVCPKQEDLSELFRFCFVKNNDLRGCAESELKVLPISFIAAYFGIDLGTLNEILRASRFSGSGLVAGFKAGNEGAAYIYEIYRLFSLSDCLITKNIINKLSSEKQDYFYILDAFHDFSAHHSTKLDVSELDFMFWHFIMEFGFAGGEIEGIRRNLFFKCYNQMTALYEKSGRDLNVIKQYNDQLQNVLDKSDS